MGFGLVQANSYGYARAVYSFVAWRNSAFLYLGTIRLSQIFRWSRQLGLVHLACAARLLLGALFLRLLLCFGV